MKKLFAIICVAAMIAACGTAKTDETKAIDSTIVKIDTTKAIDTVKADTAKKIEKAAPVKK